MVISDDRYDHLDTDTIKTLINKQKNQQPHFFTPLGYKKWLQAKGATQITELNWWQSRQVGPVTLYCTPMQNWARRRFRDRNRRICAGWAVHADNFRFYFAGDSGYPHWFEQVGQKRGPFDASAIPIGAFAP